MAFEPTGHPCVLEMTLREPCPEHYPAHSPSWSPGDGMSVGWEKMEKPSAGEAMPTTNWKRLRRPSHNWKRAGRTPADFDRMVLSSAGVRTTKGFFRLPTTGKKWDWVSAGDTHNCGLQEGKVLCWGSDAAAQTSSPGETQPDASLCAGVDCDDGDLCTTDSCLAGVCYHPQIICDDGDPCTGEMGKDYCDPETGLCQFPVWWDCDDGNPCTNDLCDGTGGCSHTPHNDFCEDGDACTVDDKCLDGQCSGIFNLCDEACVGEVIDCTDSDPCTTDYCDPQVGCLHQWIEDCF